jgi:hypothetical protein
MNLCNGFGDRRSRRPGLEPGSIRRGLSVQALTGETFFQQQMTGIMGPGSRPGRRRTIDPSEPSRTLSIRCNRCADASEFSPSFRFRFANICSRIDSRRQFFKPTSPRVDQLLI